MTKHKNVYEMPAVSDQVIGGTLVESLTLGGHSITLVRPKSPEKLLDLGEVESAYNQDEYMPYWATLWPVARYLAEEVLSLEWPAGGKAIELGCGLGLPGIAGLIKGMDVTFTDYDATALRFVEENAKSNGFGSVRTLLLDWRTPLPETFDLILASDVIYEQRNVAPLVASFTAMLAAQGTIILADQNRPHAAELRDELSKAGFAWIAKSIPVDPSQGREVSGTLYQITRV
jgi:predicted nicotinamide N-methyase